MEQLGSGAEHPPIPPPPIPEQKFLPLSYGFLDTKKKEAPWLIKGTVKTVSYLTYLTMAGTSKTAGYLGSKIAGQFLTESLPKVAAETAIDVVSGYAGETQARGQAASTVGSLIPGTGAVFGAKNAIEATNLAIGVTHVSAVVTGLLATSSALFKGFGYLAKSTLGTIQTLSNSLAQGSLKVYDDPTLVSTKLQRTAQKIQGIAWASSERLQDIVSGMASQTAGTGQKAPEKPIPRIEIKDTDIDNLSTNELKSIIWIIHQTGSKDKEKSKKDFDQLQYYIFLRNKINDKETLTENQLTEFKQYREYLLKYVIRTYNNLPAQQQQILSPFDFQQMNDFDKLSLFRIVSQNGSRDHLNKTETETYLKIEKILHEGKYPSRSTRPLTLLEEFAVSKFNALSPEVKAELFDLSELQFMALKKEEQQALVNQLLQNVPNDNSIQAIAIKEELDENDAKIICKALAKNFSFQEKLITKELLQQQVALIEFNSEDRESYITNFEKALRDKEAEVANKKVISEEDQYEIAFLVKSLLILKQDEIVEAQKLLEPETVPGTLLERKKPMAADEAAPSLHTLKQKFDMATIDAVVGKQKKGPGTIENAFNKLGSIPEAFFTFSGKALSKALNLGASEKNIFTSPSFLKWMFSITAFAMENIALSELALGTVYKGLTSCLTEEQIGQLQESMNGLNTFILETIPQLEKKFLGIAEVLTKMQNSAWESTVGVFLKNTNVYELQSDQLKQLTEKLQATATTTEGLEVIREDTANELATQFHKVFQGFFDQNADVFWNSWGQYQEAIVKPTYNDWKGKYFKQVFELVKKNNPTLSTDQGEFYKKLISELRTNINDYWIGQTQEVLTNLSYLRQAQTIIFNFNVPHAAESAVSPLQSLISQCQDLEELQELRQTVDYLNTTWSGWFSKTFPNMIEAIKSLDTVHQATTGMIEDATKSLESAADVAEKQLQLFKLQQSMYKAGTDAALKEAGKLAKEAAKKLQYMAPEEPKPGEPVTWTEAATGVLGTGMRGGAMALKGAAFAADYMTGRLALKLYLRFLARIIREVGPDLADSIRPAFARLATEVDIIGGGLGSFSHELVVIVGSGAQKAADTASRFVEATSIDAQRIFKFNEMLSDEERNHLIELALVSELVGDLEIILEKAEFKELNDLTKKEQLTSEEKERLAELTLMAYDKLGADRETLLTPSLYMELAPSAKESIKKLIRKTYPNFSEKENDFDICTKFNGLEAKKRERPFAMSYEEFMKLKRDEQETLLFQIVSSENYPKLPSTRGKNDTQLWHDNFQMIKKGLNRKKFEKLLALQRTLTPSDKNKLTPATLKEIGPEKTQQVYEILRDATWIQEIPQNGQLLLRSYFSDQRDSLLPKEKAIAESFFPTLCFLYNKTLNPTDKAKILDLQDYQVRAMPSKDRAYNEQAYLLKFLIKANAQLPPTDPNAQVIAKLQEMLKKFEQNPSSSLNDTGISEACRLFNKLTLDQKKVYYNELRSRKLIEREIVHELKVQSGRLLKAQSDLSTLSDLSENKTKRSRLQETINRSENAIDQLNQKLRNLSLSAPSQNYESLYRYELESLSNIFPKPQGKFFCITGKLQQNEVEILLFMGLEKQSVSKIDQKLYKNKISTLQKESEWLKTRKEEILDDSLREFVEMLEHKKNPDEKVKIITQKNESLESEIGKLKSEIQSESNDIINAPKRAEVRFYEEQIVRLKAIRPVTAVEGNPFIGMDVETLFQPTIPKGIVTLPAQETATVEAITKTAQQESWIAPEIPFASVKTEETEESGAVDELVHKPAVAEEPAKEPAASPPTAPVKRNILYRFFAGIGSFFTFLYEGFVAFVQLVSRKRPPRV